MSSDNTDLRYINNDDIFSDLFDTDDINKLFLKIYIRKYFKVISKVRIRSKIINIASGDLIDSDAAIDEKRRKQNALEYHLYSLKSNENTIATDLFLTLPHGKQLCNQLDIDSENIPVFCKYSSNIVQDEFKKNKASNIEKLLTVITALYTLHKSSMGEENTQIRQLKNYASKLKDLLNESDPQIESHEYLGILSALHKFVSEKSTDTDSS
tara:strand:- start:25884 stop:26516 length:633 start_codon:yes stop_codon:yes gene_type:complete